MEPPTYRLADAGDKDRIIEVCQSVRADDYVIEEFDRWFSRGTILLAEIGEETLGVLRFTMLLDGSGWVSSVRVRSTLQSKGIGRALTGEALRRMRSGGVAKARLLTSTQNTKAIRSFSAAGFREEARVHVLVQAKADRRPSVSAPLSMTGIAPDPLEIRSAPLVARLGGLLHLDYQALEPTAEAVESLARLGSFYEDARGVLAVVTPYERGGKQRISVHPTDMSPGMLDGMLALADRIPVDEVHCFVPKGTELEGLLVRGFHLSEWAAEAMIMVASP